MARSRHMLPTSSAGSPAASVQLSAHESSQDCSQRQHWSGATVPKHGIVEECAVPSRQGAPALSQMVAGMARSAAANDSMARLRLPGVVAAASPTCRHRRRPSVHPTCAEP